MPGRGSKAPAETQISQPEVDFAALVERLREELSGGDGAVPDKSRVLAARDLAERVWAVTAERPYERRPGLKGLVVYMVKRLLQPFLAWYVEPLAAEQRIFNDAVLKLTDGIFNELERVEQANLEKLDRVEQAREAAARSLTEFEERLTRVERRGPGGDAPTTVAAQPGAAAIPDYFAFEARMRGSTVEVRSRQKPYVDDFLDAAPVLDVGCGRGEFLGLLREAGVEARGIDADGDMVAYAQGERLDVAQADALGYLEGQSDGSLGGIFAAQVVEHLPPGILFHLLELAAKKLRPGGLLVAETINPLSPLALRSYFADLTHAQPLVPETLALLARQAGFREVELRFLNAPEHADDVDERIRDILFAPLDYAIIART